MTFDKIYLLKDIKGRGVAHKVIAETDDSVIISVAGVDRVIKKSQCLADFRQLGPFRGTTLTI